MSRRSNRRQFLKQAALVSTLAACPEVVRDPVHAETVSSTSRIVIIRDPAVLSENDAVGKSVREDVLAEMLDKAVQQLTGSADVEMAWASLFKPDDVVGIKVNCLGGRGATTHPEVAFAAANALIGIGIKSSNIIIWDRSTPDMLSAGYKINREGDGVRVLANDNDWEEESTYSGSINGRLTKILTREITALINMPFMKDHQMAGITGALKNHYGSFHNPMTCHGNRCDPFIADLNQIPVIRNKTRLIIMDALQPMADGGPGLRRDALWKFCGLLVSRDPVAVDSMSWKIIDERRKETGLPTVAEAGREPISIATAAARGLGVRDFDKMEIVRIG
ncbi:MAG: DUF362 domain-containing protein [Acidobacteriota bacterium]